MPRYVSPVVTSAPSSAWTGFVDDARALGTGPTAPHPSPLVGDRAVLDEDLPHLLGYAGDVRLQVTGGAGQVAGPAAYCLRHDLELVALDLTLRDLDDPAGNARRFVAALDAALAAGDVPEDTVVHVRVGGPPSYSWLQAADVLAEAEAVIALPLGAGDPEAWIDAAMDRETQVSLVGGSPAQAVAALTTAARLWGDESDLVRARRWCRSWLTDDLDAALAHLEGLS